MAIVALRYDLRVPSFSKASHAEIYQACLEQSAFADEHGLSVVALSEHHGVEDGFLPAPVTMAAAIAGRTRTIPISIAAVLLPLHDPIRLAEELAVLSLASGGRVSFIGGVGYRAEEFEMAGVDKKQRGKLLEEYVGVLRQAWTGEPFEWRGRQIRVTPKPASEPMILIGGSTPIAARRAARLRCGFSPAIGDPELGRLYDEECAKHGFQGFVAMPGGPGFVHVTRDPERDWRVIGPHALHEAQSYASWQTPDQRSQVHTDAQTVDAVRKSGVYAVVTPDECVTLAQKYGRLVLHPLMGGMPPELGWESLRLFVSDVMPRLP